METQQIQNLVALHKHVKVAQKKIRQLDKYLQSKTDDEVNLEKVQEVVTEVAAILEDHTGAFGHYLNNEEKKRRNREAIATKAAEMKNLINKLESLKDS